MATAMQRAERVVAKNGGEEVCREKLIADICTEINEAVEFALTKYVPSRVARILLDLTADSKKPTPCNHLYSYEKKNEKTGQMERLYAAQGSYDIRINQIKLAEMAGASRSYVSSLINVWKSRGIVQSVGRTICILRVDDLRRIAESEKPEGLEPQPARGA